jgi:hypothetical protein
MKTRFIILSAITLSVLLNSCKKNETDSGTPYYRFNEDDKSKLLFSYDVGEVLVYKNQDNEEISFKVVSYVKGKASARSGTFWGSSTETFFYYDRQDVVMQYAEGDEGTNCEIKLQRYPVGSNYNLQHPVEGTPTFLGYIQFPLWNKYRDTISLNNSIDINFNSPTTSMTINGNTYSKVITVQSGSMEILEPNSTLPRRPKNVNTMYYDLNAGIIGFDDLNGKMWRLQ